MIPDETDMITRPRADAMAKQIRALQEECERLRDERTELLAERARLLELFAEIERDVILCNKSKDALIQSRCFEAHTKQCVKCNGTGMVRHIKGHEVPCDRCQGKGRL